MKLYQHMFHFENECRRYDAPKENVLKWLDEQAKTIAYKNSGIHDWDVFNSKLKKHNDGHHYVLTLKAWFS